MNGGREGLIEWGKRRQAKALAQQVMHGAAGREVAHERVHCCRGAHDGPAVPRAIALGVLHVKRRRHCVRRPAAAAVVVAAATAVVTRAAARRAARSCC